MESRYKEEIFDDDGDAALEQVFQSGGSCPAPGTIHSQMWQGSEQPDLVGDAPAHCKEAGIDDL